VQHRLLLAIHLIGKVDILEPDRLLEAAQQLRPLLLHHVVLRVHKAKDLFACAQRLLKAVVVERELPDGSLQAEDRHDEQNELAQRQRCGVESALPPIQQSSSAIPTDPIASINGETDRLHAYRSQVRAKQPSPPRRGSVLPPTSPCQKL